MSDTTLAPDGVATDDRPLRSGTTAAKVMLRALAAAALGTNSRVPRNLDSVDARRILAEIQGDQAARSMKQLRVRYHLAGAAAREFQLATLRAATWADEVAAAAGAEVDPGCPARLALIATLARRLVIDGPKVAQRSATACKQAACEQDDHPTSAVPAARVPTQTPAAAGNAHSSA